MLMLTYTEAALSAVGLLLIGGIAGAVAFALASFGEASDKALDFSQIEHPGDMWRVP